MSRTEDTVSIIADSGSDTATVKRMVISDDEKTALPIPRSSTSEVLRTIDTCTVRVQPKMDKFEKGGRGKIVATTHLIYFPLTSTVSVGDRLYLASDTSDYYEVHAVDVWEDHKRIAAQKVGGR